ncbi:hypothetical protein [Wolbachia endosymbiont of Tribolium confusum]|uniref:hypothetical protein n=1 Tax=Wolbachia endosymbiont of Tribolium confusum TaxID=214474 RepID=UPI001CF4646F|nr:hypothetical protein [Wolbachia endosymbiont of Tribolium confusum]MCA7010522.1 hypothetical protein [Wolbachia endosymbiont of Tribolium confusum]
MSGFQDQEFKSNLICAMAIAGICCGIAGGIVAGLGAIDGIVTNYAISSISGLLPLVAGGMVGAGFLLSSLCAIGLIAKLSTSGFKDSSKEIVQAIAYTGVRFGIGAGLVALGFTSPAAIGAIGAVVGYIAYIPFKLLIDKAMPDTSMKIDGIDAGYWFPEIFGNPLTRG